MAAFHGVNYQTTSPVFTYYQGLQGCFYTEIFTKFSKLVREVIHRVGLVELQEGKLRFKNFAENGFKWNQEDYDHTGFRAVYCQKLFITRAEIVYDVLFIYEVHKWLPHLLFDGLGRPRSLKVASFGCGPAGELAGLEAYFSDLKVRVIKALQHDISMLGQDRYASILQNIQKANLQTVTGYDGAEGWRVYSESLGYAFVHQRIDQSFVESMEPLDILILSYFAHNADFSQPVEPRKFIWQIEDYRRNWDILQEKMRMIILIDTVASSRETLEQLQRRGFGAIEGKTDSQGRVLTVRIWFRPDMWINQ